MGGQNLSEALIWGQVRQMEHIARTVWNYLEGLCNSQDDEEIPAMEAA